MIQAVVLDTGPLGLLANPRSTAASLDCKQWVESILRFKVAVFVPEIADYEVRRELLRARRRKAIHRLEQLTHEFFYLPITTTVMRRAAELWAQARHHGQPTAGDDNLDADLILVAQAESIGLANLVIATSNVDHVGRFFPAELWSNITAAPPTP